MRASCSAHRETPGWKFSGRSTDRCAPRRFDGRRNGGDLGDEVRNAGRGTASAAGPHGVRGAFCTGPLLGQRDSVSYGWGKGNFYQRDLKLGQGEFLPKGSIPYVFTPWLGPLPFANSGLES